MQHRQPPKLQRRRSLLCMAAQQSSGRKSETSSRPIVPDIPPADSTLTSSQPMMPNESEAQSEPKAEAPSKEEPITPAQFFKQQQDSERKPNLLEGVLSEIGLIEWPTPKTALLDTALVVVIVLGSAVLLFGVNTLLAEGSRLISESTVVSDWLKSSDGPEEQKGVDDTKPSAAAGDATPAPRVVDNPQ